MNNSEREHNCPVCYKDNKLVHEHLFLQSWSTLTSFHFKGKKSFSTRRTQIHQKWPIIKRVIAKSLPIQIITIYHHTHTLPPLSPVFDSPLIKSPRLHTLLY